MVASLAKNMNFSLDINPPPNGELWGENKNGTFTGKNTIFKGKRSIFNGKNRTFK